MPFQIAGTRTYGNEKTIGTSSKGRGHNEDVHVLRHSGFTAGDKSTASAWWSDHL